jgi:hypothetical protein
VIVCGDRVELGRSGVLLINCGAQDALVHVRLRVFRFACGAREYGPYGGDLVHLLVVGRRPRHRSRQSVGVVFRFGVANS